MSISDCRVCYRRWLASWVSYRSSKRIYPPPSDLDHGLKSWEFVANDLITIAQTAPPKQDDLGAVLVPWELINEWCIRQFSNNDATRAREFDLLVYAVRRLIVAVDISEGYRRIGLSEPEPVIEL